MLRFWKLWLFLEMAWIHSDICLGFQTNKTHISTVQLTRQPYPDNKQTLSNSNHRKPTLSISGYESHMAGKSIKTVSNVWNHRHAQLIPLQFNWLAIRIPVINTHYLSQTEYHF